MGAAAVFETAAETPPTVSHRQHCVSQVQSSPSSYRERSRRVHSTESISSASHRHAIRVERTQEVDQEAGHAHEGLLSFCETRSLALALFTPKLECQGAKLTIHISLRHDGGIDLLGR